MLGLAAVSVLGGCALLGGGGKNRPQLYRFDVDAAAPAAAPARTVALNALTFQTAAAGDRLLAVQGAEAFYIARARWVSRADELFTQAAERAFSQANVRLARRGQPFTPDAGLVLTVPVFETRYLNGTESAPTVMLEVRASLIGCANRTVVGERSFSVRQPATGNTVPQIVAAYDAAVTQALGEAATWTAATAPPRS
jgi:cholesterol transport system auxiliary component